MRKMKLLIVLLLAYSGMKAQNTALQFDGVDDYVEVVSQPHRKNLRISTGFTIEFILRINSVKGKHTLLYQDGRDGVFEIGLDAEMKLYTDFNHENFLSNEPLPVSECIHVSIIYHSSGADIYMNGNPFTTITNAWSGEIFTLSEPFLLGLEQGNPSSAFDGFLENFRIINEVVDNGVIAQYTFKTLPISFPELALYLDGSMKATNKLRDPYYSPTTGYLGGTSHNGAYIPDMVEAHCVSEYDVPESVSYSCQPLPACSTVGLPAGELICNGSFEQYCSVLNGTQPAWVLPEHAFQYTSQSAGGTSLAVPGSDVVKWNPKEGSPDFYVRNGIGSPIGFYPVWGTAQNNWIAFPPNETHNGISNAVACIVSHGPFSESIITTLQQNLMPSTTYQFSGWFYNTTQTVNGSNPPSTFIGFSANLELYLENSNQSQTIFVGGLTVPYFSQVSGNNNWYYGTTTFTTPTPLTSFNRLVVKNNGIQQTLLFIDDLSLMEVNSLCPTPQFPRTISLTPKSGTLPAGTYTDYNGNSINVPTTQTFSHSNHHHAPRIVETDANGNSYVAAYINYDNNHMSTQWVSAYNPTITYSGTSPINRTIDGWSGILVSKYNECGDLMWENVIYNRAHTYLISMRVTPQGDVYILGQSESNGSAGQVLTTTAPGSFSPPPLAGNRVFVARFDANGLNTLLRRLTVTNRNAIDIEITSNDIIVMTNSGNDLEFWSFIPAVPTPITTTTNRNALKSTLHNNILYIAEIENLGQTPVIRIRSYNINTWAVVNSSQLITSNQSFVYPYATINDMKADNNGNIFITGNFNKGLSFIGGTPANFPTSVYQTYQQVMTGGTITGYVAKFTSNLVFEIADFLKPPTQINPFSFVEEYVTTNQFSSYMHDLSLDDNNNVLISGILNDVVWNSNTTISTNAQTFVCKYNNNNLDRMWINPTLGATGNDQYSGTTSIAFNPSDGQHRVVGIFSGTTKLFDNTTITTTGNHEHIFITRLEDLGNSSIFKDEPLAENNVNQGLLVYPNPANDVLNIQSNELSFAYTLLNSTGQIVLKGTSNQSRTELELDNLTNGVYILHIEGQKSEFIKVTISK